MLTPSPELDRRIAEACGIEHIVNDLIPGEIRLAVNRGGFCAPWSPSTSLDHAFEAAEAVDLWDSGEHPRSVCGSDNHGTVWEHREAGAVSIAFESTPALAICAAVLEVSKVQA